MKDSDKKALIKKHVKLSREFFLIPRHVDIGVYFDERPQESGGAACAACEPDYGFARLHFDLT